MGGHGTRTCILDLQEVSYYQRTGNHPSCLNHEHVSYNLAKELTGELLFTKDLGNGIREQTVYVYEFDWVRPVPGDKKYLAITSSDPKRWAIGQSDNMSVHKLVRG